MAPDDAHKERLAGIRNIAELVAEHRDGLMDLTSPGGPSESPPTLADDVTRAFTGYLPAHRLLIIGQIRAAARILDDASACLEAMARDAPSAEFVLLDRARRRCEIQDAKPAALLQEVT